MSQALLFPDHTLLFPEVGINPDKPKRTRLKKAGSGEVLERWARSSTANPLRDRVIAEFDRLSLSWIDVKQSIREQFKGNAGDIVDDFDFVVHENFHKHMLVLLAPPDEFTLPRMLDWAAIFGDEYRAAFTIQPPGEEFRIVSATGNCLIRPVNRGAVK